ncbi:translocation/assembly module TamB domain-containing protein [Crocosphaera sp.]|uniref:translocation/assembly module TamB domain-containing protein n=1 Tax=Crocosphaera sp. TaxID=2729996 RepID=UPI003F29DBC3|nr:translocation/assembly module TamB domain-containing protein [Crocosphaera sp.]
MTTNRSPKQRDSDLQCSQKVKPRKRHYSWMGWGVSVVLLGLGGGTVAGGFLAQRNLTPVVEQQLSRFLNRPVALGSLQSFSFNYIRFGPTDLLTTPTDPANVSMSGLKIAYNPLKYIIDGKLEIEVTAIEPSAYLEQGKGGEWLVTQFNTLNPNNPIRLKGLAIEKGDAIIVSRSDTGEKEEPITLQNLSGMIQPRNQNNQISFRVSSHIVDSGIIDVSGRFDGKQKETNLLVRGHQVKAKIVSQVLPLPIELQSGKIDANLEVLHGNNKLGNIQGVARLNQVYSRVQGLPQSLMTQGQLRFKERKINFDNVTTQFGEVAGVIQGDIDLDKGFDLTAKTEVTSITDIFKTIKQQPNNLSIAGKVTGDLKLTGQFDNPNVLIGVNNEDSIKIDRVNFTNIKANLALNKSKLTINDFQAIPTIGGEIIGKGSLNLNSSSPLYSIDIQGKSLPTASLASLYDTSIPSYIKQVSTQVNLSGNLQQPETFKAIGKANFQAAGGTVKAEHITYTNSKWQSDLLVSGISLNTFNSPIKQGIVQGNIQVSGNTKKSIKESLNATGELNIKVDDGWINAQKIQLAQGKWRAKLQVNETKINQLLPQTDLQGKLNGNFDLAGGLNPNINNIQAKGQGYLTVGGGQIVAKNLNLYQGQWSTEISSQNVNVKSLSDKLPEPLSGKLNSNLTLVGTVNPETFLNSIEGKGNATLILNQGAIAAKDLTITQGNFTTTLTPSAVPLRLIASQLTGNLSGNLEIAGKLNKIAPEYLQAKGDLQFSQGLPYVNRSLTTTIQWDGQRLTLDQITGSDLTAKGWLDIDLENKKDKLAAIKAFSFDIDGKNFDLTSFPLSLPIEDINYGGKLDFKGAIAGTPNTPNIEGEMSLINLRVEEINFEPVISGNILKNSDKGLKLALNGTKDQLHVQLDPQLQPLTVAVKQEKVDLTANKKDNRWKIDISSLSLPIIQKIAQKQYKNNSFLLQPMTGQLSGHMTLDLENKAIAGQNVAILNPIVGTIQAKQVKGDFHYANQSLAVKNTKIFTHNSQYDLNGQLTQTPQGPDIAANITINRGKLQDILETLQIFELEDLKRGLNSPKYAKAADLYQNNNNPQTPLFKVETAKQSLGDRLETLKQITAWLKENKEEEKDNQSLPGLERLKGDFNGKISLNIAPKTGFNLNFDLLGEKWQWGQYQLTQFQARGSFKEGILTLEPFNLELEDSAILFAGQVGPTSQQGQLQVENIPLATLSKWVNLPSVVTLGGQLNANMNLGGTRDNPQASGRLAINQPTINQTLLASSQGQFTYEKGQFNFSASSVLDRQSEPLTIEGTFPYVFPLANVQPESDRLLLKFQAKNEGLTLLNILSQGQVAWLGGTGTVQLNLSGKVDPKRGIPYELQADGLAQVKNATIATKMMPQIPFQEVQGKILFDLDTITFDGFTGQFSGGQVAVSGSLPLLKLTENDPSLTIQLNNLALDLPQIYQGGVQGNLNIGGSVLSPEIGGEVNLFSGQVLLKEKAKKPKTSSPLLASTKLNNLRLNLGNKITITRPPILTFLATGNLALNGTLENPEPNGIITLENGLVNLFASQLRLAGGKDNIAQFLPEKGFDPYLDIQLFAAATETTQNTININPNSAEVPETFRANKDSLETVRIKANVEGFASNITQSIKLSSQPKRSEQQIVTLLGGTFLNTLGTGETTLGLANLAGTAVFGPVQGAIGEALGLSEFRIFPTPLINQEDALDTSNIGVAAEAGLDLTEDFSLSIQTIVNSDRPPKLGLQYRINDTTTLRGSSNFSDDNRGSIQFEQRF